jgi:uncharacterized protein YcbX
MSSIQPAQVTKIYRYPAKGLSAQPLPSGSAGTKLVEFCDRICKLTSNVDESTAVATRSFEEGDGSPSNGACIG